MTITPHPYNCSAAADAVSPRAKRGACMSRPALDSFARLAPPVLGVAPPPLDHPSANPRPPLGGANEAGRAFVAPKGPPRQPVFWPDGASSRSRVTIPLLPDGIIRSLSALPSLLFSPSGALPRPCAERGRERASN
jgi:hypothetical protein